MPDFEKLDILKQAFDSYRPLPPEVVFNLHEDLVLRWTYNSKANERKMLTFKGMNVFMDALHTKQDYETFLALITEVVETGLKPYWHVLGVNP